MATTNTTTATKSSTTAKKTTSTRKTSTTAKSPVQMEISAENGDAVVEKKTTKPRTPKPNPEVEMLKQQIELLKQQLAQQAAQPQLVRIANDEEKIVFVWNAPVADENVIEFGPNGIYGRITGKHGTFFVPKSELSRVLDNKTRNFLDRRWLIVASGMTDEEMRMLDIAYKPGELLDEASYKYIVEMEDKILDLYPDLHNGHKYAVAQRYYEQWQHRNPHIKRDVVARLIKMSAGKEKEAFQRILEEMNQVELNG